jgi:hypothetical protein
MPTSTPSFPLRLSPSAIRNISGVSAVSALSSTCMSPTCLRSKIPLVGPKKTTFPVVRVEFDSSVLRGDRKVTIAKHMAATPHCLSSEFGLETKLGAGLCEVRCTLPPKIGGVCATAAKVRSPPLASTFARSTVSAQFVAFSEARGVAAAPKLWRKPPRGRHGRRSLTITLG